MSNKLFTTFLLFSFLACFASCGKIKGDFVFRSGIDTRYKKLPGIPEFESQQKINWCYIIEGEPEERKLYVHILKKELIWVNISKSIEALNIREKIIYGKITGLKPGKYMIKISDNESVIVEKYFLIYTQH